MAYFTYIKCIIIFAIALSSTSSDLISNEPNALAMLFIQCLLSFSFSGEESKGRLDFCV